MYSNADGWLSNQAINSCCIASCLDALVCWTCFRSLSNAWAALSCNFFSTWPFVFGCFLFTLGAMTLEVWRKWGGNWHWHWTLTLGCLSRECDKSRHISNLMVNLHAYDTQQHKTLTLSSAWTNGSTLQWCCVHTGPAHWRCSEFCISIEQVHQTYPWALHSHCSASLDTWWRSRRQHILRMST